MNKKQKIIVSVVGITIVLLTLLGLTYAYFLTRIQGNTNEKSISVTTADLKLVYGDGNGLIEADSIMPGTTLTTKKFTVKNEGNAKVDNYVVYLEELVSELTRPDDMVYTLTCTSDIENKTCKGVNETTFPKLAGIVVTNSIEVGETQSYELTVTYKEMNVDQSDDMNKKISARVQIYNLQDIVDITGTVTNASEGDYVEMHSDPKTSMITTDNKYLIAAVEPGTHTIYVKDKEGNVRGSKEITIKKGSTASVDGTNITVTNDSQTINVDITAIATTLTIDVGVPKDYMPFEEGTLAYNILNNAKINANGTIFSKEPLTISAQAVSGENEKTLSIAEDDYGTSYYYRGSVTDNYMEFNNMCWRIVRIEGDGSVKIILAKEGLCSTITSSDTTSALINNGTKIPYGYKDDANYKHRFDYENSTDGLYSTLKTWYTSSGLESKKSQLKNEKWCLGGSDSYRYNYSTGILLTDAEVKELENNNRYYYYTSGKRLNGVGVEKSATLKCSSEEDNVNDYIGTITADEVTFAGGQAGYSNKFYYLYDNAQSSYWSLSRSGFDVTSDKAFCISFGSNLSTEEARNYINLARPAITLATGTKISSGNGTISNPYKILES